MTAGARAVSAAVCRGREQGGLRGVTHGPSTARGALVAEGAGLPYREGRELTGRKLELAGAVAGGRGSIRRAGPARQ